MRNYPYLILSLILILVLGIPFILKLKDPRLEIYPAVIFPSGDNIVKTSNSKVSFYQYELYAYNPVLRKIDKDELLGNIPVQYFYPIYEGHFGLEKYSEEFKLYKPPISFRIQNNYSSHSVEETKNWLKKRLRNSGYSDSVFMVKVFKSTFNLKSQSLESKNEVNEKVFRLY